MSTLLKDYNSCAIYMYVLHIKADHILLTLGDSLKKATNLITTAEEPILKSVIEGGPGGDAGVADKTDSCTLDPNTEIWQDGKIIWL